MVLLAQAADPPHHRTFRAVNSPVDRDVKIGLGILNHHAGNPRQRNLDVATLVEIGRAHV